MTNAINLVGSSAVVTGIEGTALPTTTLIGTFTDNDPDDNRNDESGNATYTFIITVDWGDNTSIVTLDSTNLFITNPTSTIRVFEISASHQYSNVGNYAITISITSIANFYMAVISSHAIIADAPLNVASNQPTINGPIVNGLIVSFTDGNLGGSTSDFTATIDWGDSTSLSLGTLISSGSGTFDISGSHKYANAGYYKIQVNISDVGGSQLTIVNHASCSYGNSPILTASIPQPTVTGPIITGLIVGDGADIVSFTSDNPTTLPSDFTAEIDWGDGKPLSFGTMTQPLGTGTTFTVTGIHKYSFSGTYTIWVNIKDVSGSTTSIKNFASCLTGVNPVLTASSHQPVVSVASHVAFIIATFTDSDTTATINDFTAIIDWGDGTSLSLGYISKIESTFGVIGDHKYALAGDYNIIVNVRDDSGSCVSINNIISCSVGANSVLTASSLQPTITGPIVNGSLVNFTDSDTTAIVSDFTAIIDWGDGKPLSLGSVIQIGDIGIEFSITGNHTYDLADTYIILVNVKDISGSIVSIGNSVICIVGTNSILTALSHQPTITGPAVNGHIVSFTDSDTMAIVSDFTAIIDWGDDKSLSIGTITEASGVFSVNGSHNYVNAGTYTVLVNVIDISSRSSINIKNTATFSTGTGSILTIGTQPVLNNSHINGPIATFNDSNSGALVGDFTTTIDWGDGTSLSHGTITQPLGVGTTFVVNGLHTYTKSGTYDIIVYVNNVSDIRIVIINSDTFIIPDVVNVPIVGPINISAFPVIGHKQVSTGLIQIATFIDESNSNLPTHKFSVRINWGDSLNLQRGTITQCLAGTSQYSIIAKHTYKKTGTYPIVITITDRGTSNSNSPLIISCGSYAQIGG